MKIFLAAVSVLLTTLFVYAPTVQAVGVVFGENTICSSGRTTGAASCNNSTKKNPINTFLGFAVDFAILIAGAIAAIFVIVGGIKYILSQDDPTKMQNARDTIVYALVGLFVAVFCKQIASWAISKF